MSVVYEEQNTDVSWYANEIIDGTAKDNFQRIIELRKAFCHPLTINKDGTLNKKYFSTVTKETAMNWNDIELLQLYEGIYKHGVDSVEKWIKIQADFLPQRDFIEVRLKLSQLFGVQDLSVYKDRTFKSEKEINDEYEKNKKESQENGNWNKKCAVALKEEISSLNRNQTQKLQENELEDWNKYVYDNPIYIYRTNNPNIKKKTRKSKNNKNKKKSAKKQKVQKNTIDQIFKKKVDFAEPVSEIKEFESMEIDENENNNQNKNNKNGNDEQDKEEIKSIQQKTKKQQNKNTRKNRKPAKKKPKSKQMPLLPDVSDDEEMLCVE